MSSCADREFQLHSWIKNNSFFIIVFYQMGVDLVIESDFHNAYESMVIMNTLFVS